MDDIKITPEVLEQLLRLYNLTRREFIETYQIPPLVYIPELPASAKTTFVIVYTVIFLLALVGNSLVVYIVLIKRGIQTATNIFIGSLAVSDLLISFFCIPFTLLQNISSEWFGGKSVSFRNHFYYKKKFVRIFILPAHVNLQLLCCFARFV